MGTLYEITNELEMLYEMVCRAETYFEGSGRGAEKKEWVVCQIHQALPDWAKM